MTKKKTILDMFEEQQEEVIETKTEDKVFMLDGNAVKRQTYCITKKNIELIRLTAFYENLPKQEIVHRALDSYFKENFPELYQKIEILE